MEIRPSLIGGGDLVYVVVEIRSREEEEGRANDFLLAFFIPILTDRERCSPRQQYFS